MKKIFLSLVMLLSAVCSFAQDSFETALDLQIGDNSSQVYQIGDYYKGAYFKYHADQTCVLTVAGKSLNYTFFNADQEENWNYYSVDKGTFYAYSIKVEAGQDIYVCITQSYGADGNTINFTAEVETDVLEHGMSAEDPQTIESGKKYWFEGGNAFMTYTATEEGVLVLNVTPYLSAEYIVDGTKTTIEKDDDNNVNIPVTAGKTYAINFSSYTKLYPVSVKFTQPQQGDTKENPFTLVIGDNTLPAAAQKYYYAYTNGDKTGFLTINANGKIYVRDIENTYDNIVRGEDNMAQVLLTADQAILVTIEKAEATAEAEVFTVTFAEPAAGDLEETAIELTPSETAAVEAPAGTKYYTISNTGAASIFLNVAVDTEGISSYGSSTVKVYKDGENPDWYGTAVEYGSPEAIQMAAGAKYYVRVINKETTPIKFRVWTEEITQGDVYGNPIIAVAGDNAVAAGQKFYSYTPATTCKLTVKVDLEKATVFFPNYDGDEYYGRDLLSSGNGVYVLAAEAGQAYIMRVTASEATTMNIEEVAYGAGDSRETAQPFDGTYTFNDLNPYRTWLVYEVQRGGIAEITCTGMETITYDDNINIYLNEEAYGTGMRGYDDSYNYVMNTVKKAVAEGDKIYVFINVASYAEGAQLVVNVRDAEPGESPANPIMLTTGEENPNALPYVGYSDNPVWFAFEATQDGQATFAATEYLNASLYNSEMVQIKAGEYSDTMYVGGYYDPVTLSLTAGKYYFCLESNSNEANALTLTGSAFEGATGITEVVAGKKAVDGIYNMAGQRVSADAKGLLIINGRKVLKK